MAKPTRRINVSYLFYWRNTLHVSDGLSVHHQELKTVHTVTDICKTDIDDCLLASLLASTSFSKPDVHRAVHRNIFLL